MRQSEGLSLRRATITALATTTMLTAFSGAVSAQQDDAGLALDEIIVTALKRSTSIQSTPVSITAVTGESLERRGADDFIDYAASVPGLTLVDNGPGERRLVIRGINGVGEAQVGLYYDETFVTGAPGAGADSGARQPDFKLIDINRVEVLRGPQGTLYGSGSVGGTLRVITNKPDTENYDGFIEGGLSTTKTAGQGYEGSGMANLPLVEGKLGLRVVGYYRDETGYIDNVALGNDDINNENTWGGRAALRFQAADNVTLDATVMLQRTDTNGRPEFFPGVGDLQTDRVTQETLIDNSEIYNLTLNWDMGPVTLVASTSFYNRFLEFNFDTTPFIAGFDNPGICAARAGGTCDAAQLVAHSGFINGLLPATVQQPQNVENWTNEIRLSSNGDGPFYWTAGFFTEDRKSDLKSQVLAATPEGLPRDPFEFIFFREAFEQVDQISVFGEATYDLTEQLHITGGVRFFDYDKTNQGETIVGFSLVNAPAGPAPDGDASENGKIFKGNISYDVNDDVLLYAQVVEGFRLGGANQSVFVEVPPQFNSDSVTNWEMGAKTTLMGGAMTLNAALFRMAWSDVQVNGSTPDGAFAFIGNAGNAKVDGIEVEMEAQPVEGLYLSGGLTVLDARLSTDQIDEAGDFRSAGLQGDRIPRVPEFTFSATAQYFFPIMDEVDGNFRVDLSHSGGQTSEFRDDDVFFLRFEDYTLVNARFGIDSETWSAQIYATNLFDTRAQSNRSFDAFTDRSIFTVRPRTIGVKVRRNF